MIIIVVALVGAAAALWTLGRPRRLAGGGEPVPGDPHGGRAAIALISVVIPARDEAANLPRLLRSLTTGDVLPAEIIVVDDHSSDGSGALAAALGARVIAAPPLPTGWTGKTWACQTGADAAGQPTLLFLDADTWLAGDAIALLAAEHTRSGGLLSVQPFHVTERPYEELSAMFNAVALMGSAAFSLRPPGSLRVAFGPCLITSAADYRAVGGHAAVRDEVVEDIALAAGFAAAGLPVACRLGGAAIRFRMYPDGVRALVQGWSKNIAMGARKAPVAHVLPAVLWIAALAAVATAAISGVVGWLRGGGPPVVALIAYGLATAQVFVVLRRIGSFRPRTSLFYFVPLLAFVVIFVRSLVAVVAGSSVMWRGRPVPARTGRSG